MISKTKMHINWPFLLLIFCLNAGYERMYAQNELKNIDRKWSDIDQMVAPLMDEGNIPGMSLILYDNGNTYVKTYGLSSISSTQPISEKTRFQLGESGLPYIALAILDLEAKGRLKLNDKVDLHINSFKPKYQGESYSISINQLLYHTSGISDRFRFEEGQNLINRINKSQLVSIPGEVYSFSLANYVLLKQLIEHITKSEFEEYLTQNIFTPLQMKGTTFGSVENEFPIATGHKISFKSAEPFSELSSANSNSILGIYSNALDMSNWLKAQFEAEQLEFYSKIGRTHKRDATVAPSQLVSSAMGWQVMLDGSQNIVSQGETPTFSSFMAINKTEQFGIILLANSNSDFTASMGSAIMNLQHGTPFALQKTDQNPGNDKVFSNLCIVLMVYMVILLAFMGWLFHGIKTKRRYFKLQASFYKKLGGSILLVLPLFIGVYFLPQYLGYDSWQRMFLWNSDSLSLFVKLLSIASGVTLIMYCLTLLYPMRNNYLGKAPQIVVMGIIAGISHIVMISMVSTAFDLKVNIYQHILYYVLALLVFIVAKRIFEYNLIHISKGIAFDLRVKLIKKIFYTSYQNFERIDKGRVYSALNDDVNMIGIAASTFTGLAISFVTIVGIFIYLLFIEFSLTMILLVAVILLAYIYHVVGKAADRYYEEARDEKNIFSRLLDGMLNGFKEISIHQKGKKRYKRDLVDSADRFKNKTIIANLKFLNAELLGESMILLVLGVIAFGATKIAPEINFYLLASYIIVLLYMLNPIQALLDAVPNILQVRVAWRRINAFMTDLPTETNYESSDILNIKEVTTLEVKGVKYSYKNEDPTSEAFKIGPIDFKAESGEIVFIIGANGSGKSTLAKLLIGLYESESGGIKINGQHISNDALGNCFSAVFNPSYLFKKLYNINEDSYDKEKVNKLLKILGLEGKVVIENNEYSTIELSSGQRKRLGLLQCYLEDAPIFLFDEWAADQDPHYRNFFYNTLLPEIKSLGKIVIAITHDDNYFHVADRIMEMRDGRLGVYSTSESTHILKA